MAATDASLGGNAMLAEIVESLMGVQDHICAYLEGESGQTFVEDKWEYHKGSGGGRTRVMDGSDTLNSVIEKGGVNFSHIVGTNFPASGAVKLNISADTPFHATGVSMVLHPRNPLVPTVHLNVRYFEAGSVWWFGGGVDVTPYYPQLAQASEFHRGVKAVCERHAQPYDKYKKWCDDYFYLKHRKETRGIGGLFFDQLQGDNATDSADETLAKKKALLAFIVDVGKSFTTLYHPFLADRVKPYTTAQREYQLIRRGRYVEFNLLFDRGTKFGIESDGRTESILMSLPAEVHWKYDYRSPPGSVEDRSVRFFNTPRDYATLPADAFDKFE